MALQKNFSSVILIFLVFSILTEILPNDASASDTEQGAPNNFGLPGNIDLPTAKRFPDGEIVITQQLHKSLARIGISFQALPRLGLSFRYSGHGIDGGEAYGRINHDRSFDAHVSLLDEGIYAPSISIGLRDFIGTGWYSSEYIVGTKTISNLELTAGLGFGRLAGKNTFSNPFGILSSKFDRRGGNAFGRGGTLGTINWFQGEAASFYGIRYQLDDKTTLSAEYTSDLMLRESSYLRLESPWSFGLSRQLNNYFNLSAQYLHGNQLSITAQINVNPNRPPLPGGKDLAPVPMRLRGDNTLPFIETNEKVIRKVLAADRFEILNLDIKNENVSITVYNNKFRSTAQAVGRIASTLQRFTSDEIKFAQITFYSLGLQTATYLVDLEKITEQQFDPPSSDTNQTAITAFSQKTVQLKDTQPRLTWGVGPYVAHRLFNPELPLSVETGIEFIGGYRLLPGLKLSTSLRKSVLTNLTKNARRSNSILPHVHSDWPLYDIAGQSGHIHSLTLSYSKNLAPGLFGTAHVGLLEPFFAGIGGEILYKPAHWPVSFGIDLHRVRKRDFDMKFDLLDYETTVGHFSVYYDAGGMFDLELNAGRYLAGDWGATTKISRKFGSGWEVGGYATLTDVPFETFGEGSFDKAIFVSIPIDWITSTPNQAQRILTIRPITRDGGAQLSSARSLYRVIKRSQNSDFKREIGRLWK